MATAANSQRPPEPPHVTPAIRLSVAQSVGIGLIALLSLLGLAGLFGESMVRRVDRHGPLTVSASVPARLRYRQRMTLQVSVANRGNETMSDVRVRIDSSYVDRFSAVVLSPQASPDGVVRFGSLGAGQSVMLAVTLEGDRSGAIGGSALVTDAQGDTVRVPLTSTVFP
ncbi:MAG TPA: hypothetical protein VGG84_06700 [Gemmatimonadaceae bacterium]